MITHSCRACRGSDGEIVLDLGVQPASDFFPVQYAPGPDPRHPLQMWLCGSCGLAQLLTDPTEAEEVRGVEPAAMVSQAKDALERLSASGWLQSGMRVVEYGSPHGGSWAPLLEARGVHLVGGDDGADAVLDCFGLMHVADQAAALAERTARVRPGGVLLLQYHSLAAILRLGQWNSLRHGHYAYHSMTALLPLLARFGFSVRSAWQFDLFGGTVLLAATHDDEPVGSVDLSVREILDVEEKLGVRDPDRVRHHLQDSVESQVAALRDWLERQHQSGKVVLGYGAASRAVALLCRARVDKRLLAAVADASPAKAGRRMPGTDIPVISPADLVAARPNVVLLLISDLGPEVRSRLPEIESGGGEWVAVDDLVAGF
jgi:SAM-dependent methyltransferase